MWEWLKIFLVGIFLAWQAVEDLRKKSIRMDAVLLFGIIGVCLYVATEGIHLEMAKEVFWACVPGMVLTVISKFCNGALGDGDGMIFLVTGLYLGGVKTGWLVYCSFLLVCIVGLCVLVIETRPKRQRSYPFVPFVFSAFIMLEIWGIKR